MRHLNPLKNNQARNRLLATTDHIKTLRITVVALLVMVVMLGWHNSYLQDVRRFYIPPDLTHGLVTDLRNVPAPLVYTFAYHIFQQLHRWPEDGEKDYAKKIYALQAFLTPICRRALENDMNEKYRLGELRKRVRSMQEVFGQSYSHERVLIESHGSWLIWLDVNINEWINDHPVKNVMLRYRLNVVRFDVDRELNPWGLALACNDDTRPALLNEDDIDTPFTRTEVM